MSTRSTIEVRYSATATKDSGFGESFYKHHDGYIKGGLGELLIHFVTYTNMPKMTFLNRFQEFAKEHRINAVADDVNRLEKLDNVESYREHGDTEYHYTIMPSNKGWLLTVQERDYTDSAQNGTDQTKTGHWTDFAPRKTIGRAGILMPIN
tara:strand:+ start:8495 stop:8947 length:453 start_codon:yes stop_codon:yes gene_type:complete